MWRPVSQGTSIGPLGVPALPRANLLEDLRVANAGMPGPMYKLGEDVLAKLVIRQQYDSSNMLSLFNLSGTAIPDVLYRCKPLSSRPAFGPPSFHTTGLTDGFVSPRPMFWTCWLLHVILFSVMRGATCERGEGEEGSASGSGGALGALDGEIEVERRALKIDPTCMDAKETLNNLVPLAIADLGLLNGLTAFFIVFYAGNCFMRYTGESSPSQGFPAPAQ